MSNTKLVFDQTPVNGYPITGSFGQWYDGPPAYQHRGVDFGCPTGTPIRCPADGYVVNFTNDGSFGIGVCIEHTGTGLYSLYAHMSSKNYNPGQKVFRNDILGLTGNTGASTGPHLHWQVCVNTQFPIDISYSRDPLSFIGEDEMGMTPEEKAEFEKLKRVVCEWGQPGNLQTLDMQNTNLAMYIDQLNAVMLRMKAAMNAAGMNIY